MMMYFTFVFFNDTATTEIYTLSLHDALPIFQKARSKAARATGFTGSLRCGCPEPWGDRASRPAVLRASLDLDAEIGRAHSELQSRQYLVCRLLLEKKKKEYTLNSTNKSHRIT